ncbi:hypothetical protein [Levilactobacillus enshiensis]|uniref:hypothetical protein n=1 Tax=Levilactobacillus enshiensis TaxID=2590213 RepID=UPI00117B99F0|nr:hypothetical protein [Levilactobacillus enshiensis]
MEPATEKQESFIHKISMILVVEEPLHLSKSEATRWISDHIEAYDMKLEEDENDLASSTLSGEFDWM